MKRILLTIAFVLALVNANAQTDTTAAKSDGFNKWSIEFNAGVNKPQRPFTVGYYTDTPSPWNADFAVRYMFNPKFGAKASVGYYKFAGGNGSQDFKTQYYRVDLEGVANLGRIMNFESWTKTLGLLAHLGGGYSQMNTDGQPFTDRQGNFIVGLTGQVKLSKKLVLTGDLTSITNVRQSKTFDGQSDTYVVDSRGFSGGIISGTIGLTVYLGKNAEHADWTAEDSKLKDELEALKQRVGDLEVATADTDQDGVMDSVDKEPNSSPVGVAVDSHGVVVDKNGNGVADELEKYLDKKYGDSGKSGLATTTTTNNNELIKNLINEGYVTTYFDYNKSTPTNVSTEGIDFILTYLRNNPTASVDIIGHADELGKSAYNDNLSSKRANAVKSILLKAKIDASRLNIVSGGEDTSVVKESAGARKLVRRVTFKVK
ncbi:MAG: OmpA family protein [Flavobacterium sp.]|nr:OmpA family protein [Flavobacterium sp.]